AEVKIRSIGPVEIMDVDAEGLPPKTEFDLFVIQLPNKPFGVSWYQGDLETDKRGEAHGKFIGRFSIETFAVAPGSGPAPVVHNDGPNPDAASNPAFGPIHTFHLGLWFNSPKDAQAAGCGSDVTPFNGDHNAGVQVVSTRDPANDQGPVRLLRPEPRSDPYEYAAPPVVSRGRFFMSHNSTLPHVCSAHGAAQRPWIILGASLCALEPLHHGAFQH